MLVSRGLFTAPPSAAALSRHRRPATTRRTGPRLRVATMTQMTSCKAESTCAHPTPLTPAPSTYTLRTPRKLSTPSTKMQSKSAAILPTSATPLPFLITTNTIGTSHPAPVNQLLKKPGLGMDAKTTVGIPILQHQSNHFLQGDCYLDPAWSSRSIQPYFYKRCCCRDPSRRL